MYVQNYVNSAMEGNLNYKFFKTLRGARIFVLQVRNTKPFDMCLGYSKAYVVSFFLDSGDLSQKLPHLRFTQLGQRTLEPGKEGSRGFL